MRFRNLARHPDIGTNCYLLEFDETRIVLDSGTHPKHSGADTLPRFSDIEDSAIDAVIVSHPHLDHIGALPCLVDKHPEATVVMSEGTRQAGRALLHNSVNVMTALRKELDEPMFPLYSHRQVDRQYKQWMTRGLNAPFSIGDADRVQCEFYHAGHVLGAVGIMFRYKEKSVFYTGDVHFEDQTLTTGAQFPRQPVDTLIIESTRGDSIRQAGYQREAEKRRLGATIAETMEQGGAVLIPVFAFGKTQEVVLMLKELMEAGSIPCCPVHIGGLSSKMTGISDEHCDDPRRMHRGFKILQEFPDLRVMPRGRSEPEYSPGHIYALSSGMMSENTVSNRFARHMLSKPEDTIIFVGYADPESPAGLLQNLQPGENVVLDKKKREIPLRCRVERFDFSGHAPREQLVDYAVSVSPGRIFLVHGDPRAKEWLRSAIQDKLPDADVLVPNPGESLDL